MLLFVRTVLTRGEGCMMRHSCIGALRSHLQHGPLREGGFDRFEGDDVCGSSLRGQSNHATRRPCTSAPARKAASKSGIRMALPPARQAEVGTSSRARTEYGAGGARNPHRTSALAQATTGDLVRKRCCGLTGPAVKCVRRERVRRRSARQGWVHICAAPPACGPADDRGGDDARDTLANVTTAPQPAQELRKPESTRSRRGILTSATTTRPPW